LHAAAYKHVPLVEANPLSGLVNNVLGTHVLATEALRAKVERFTLISTDKAVRPTSVMGASKRMAELIVQDMARKVSSAGRPIFSMVRFGNVLGSSGSVIPLFQEQISRGGPLTVTDERVTRYFMTVQEAARLVLKSGALAHGGEVFVFDMGKPVSIMQIARQVIENAGFTLRDPANPDGDIEIVTTGLRPGEKLVEELTLSKEISPTKHAKIFSVREANLSELEIALALRSIRDAANAGSEDMARAVVIHWFEIFHSPQRADQARSLALA
ncbi:MAG: polysaccharide biosynthesis protein, partial [Sulfitobacter sp.]